MLIATLSFQGAAIILIAWLLLQYQVSWREAFGFFNHWHQAVIFGLLVACIFLPVASLLQTLSAQAMTHLPFFPIKPEEQPAIQTLRIATSWFDRLALGIVTILLAPVAEEMLFRGVLYPWIKQAGFPRLALWGTSMAFAAIHGKLVVFLPLMVLALLLTALYEKTNNLLAPITAHASFNAVNFAMLYLMEKQT
jgi:membrane protease YdiL (CAAX protease family)